MLELFEHWHFRTARATPAFPPDERTSTNNALRATWSQCIDEMHAAVFGQLAFDTEIGEVGISYGELIEALHRIWGGLPVCKLQSEDRR